MSIRSMTGKLKLKLKQANLILKIIYVSTLHPVISFEWFVDFRDYPFEIGSLLISLPSSYSSTSCQEYRGFDEEFMVNSNK